MQRWAAKQWRRDSFGSWRPRWRQWRRHGGPGRRWRRGRGIGGLLRPAALEMPIGLEDHVDWHLADEGAERRGRAGERAVLEQLVHGRAAAADGKVLAGLLAGPHARPDVAIER